MTKASTTDPFAPDSDPPVPEALVERIRSGRSFLLTSHVNPDGDAIGSGLGLARVLETLGKRVLVWNRDETPDLYSPLPGSQRIHTGDTPPEGFPEAFDTAIVLECPTLDRCGIEEHFARLPMLNIDHHLGNDEYGEQVWIDTSSASLGLMIYRLARALGAEVDAETANTLYLTLVTDTGNFRFSNVNADAFAAAASLVRDGAEPERVSHWLYESRPESALRLLSAVLDTMELHSKGRISTAWLTRATLEATGAGPGDSEGLVDYPRSIAGVEAVALFRELADGRVKVSLRSRGEISVEQVARARGGGGHRNAAGFTSTLEDVPSIQTQVVGALEQALGSTI